MADIIKKLDETNAHLENKHEKITSLNFLEIDINEIALLIDAATGTLTLTQNHLKTVAQKIPPIKTNLSRLRQWIEKKLKEGVLQTVIKSDLLAAVEVGKGKWEGYRTKAKELVAQTAIRRNELGQILRTLAKLEQKAIELGIEADKIADEAYWATEEGDLAMKILIENAKAKLKKEEEERRRRELEEKRKREEEERRRREEEERRAKEEEEKRRKEEEEQKRLEEERRRKEKEERLRRLREERLKKEEEERRRREEEERKRTEEEERKRQEEEQRRKEEEERLRLEELERQRKEEEERKKREEDERKRKEEEERKRREEEERRRKEEEQRKREAKERRRREEEERKRRDPANWPIWIYYIENGELDIPIGCVVRAIPGPLKRESLIVELVDRTDGGLWIDETDELISQVINVRYADASQVYELEEPLAIALPHCAPKNVPTREPVIKKMLSETTPWVGQPSNVCVFDNIREHRFVECRLQQPGSLAVVFRFRKETHDLSPAGCTVNSAVDSRLSFAVPASLYQSNDNVQLQLNPVDPFAVTGERGRPEEGRHNFISCSPIVDMVLPGRELSKPVTVTVPVPGSSELGIGKGDVHLMKSNSDGKWQPMPHVYVNEDQASGLSSFTTRELLKRFAVLKCKKRTPDEQLSLLMEILDRAIKKRHAQIILRQHENDPGQVALMCVNPNNTYNCITQLKEEGYSKGPSVDAPIQIDEGQVLRVGFRGNLKGKASKLKIAYNTYIKSRLDLDVCESDPYLQKNLQWFRGYLQLFCEKRAGHNESSDSGAISELLLTLPKPQNQQERHRPIVVLRPQSILTKEFINDVAHKVKTDWERLAKPLGISLARISDIKKANVNSEENAAFDMLTTWVKGSQRGRDNVGILCQALLRIGRSDVEAEVREKDRKFKQQANHEGK